MRLIVIEDDTTILANFKELMSLEFPETTLERAIFIDSVSGIKEGLKDLVTGEKYVIVLDNQIIGGTSVESLNTLKDIPEVWNNIERIYGFSAQKNEQKELVGLEFPELMELYTQSSKTELLPLLLQIKEEHPLLAEEVENSELARPM